MQSTQSFNPAELAQNKACADMRELDSFLLDGLFVTEKNDNKTNIIDCWRKKTYNVPQGTVPVFFKLLEKCRLRNRTLHYSERQTRIDRFTSGIMIDFDFFQESSAKQITQKHYLDLSRALAYLLRELIDFPSSGKKDFYLFFITKPSLQAKSIKEGETERQVYKDGFHILIPELQVSKEFKRLFFTRIREDKLLDEVFADCKSVYPYEKMIDFGSIANPVHFVGNCKVGSVKYDLTYACKAQIDKYGINSTEISTGGLVAGKWDNNAINLSYELSLSFYFEQIDGAPTWLRKTEMVYSDSVAEKLSKFVVVSEQSDKLPDDEDIGLQQVDDERLHELRQYLDLLDQSYCTDYDKWFKVVCAIANTSTNYKDLAIWFSMKNPAKWSASKFDELWDSVCSTRGESRSKCTWRSIMYWAKQCRPDKFKEITKNSYRTKLLNAIYQFEGKIEHSVAAELLYIMFERKFVVDYRTDDGAPHYVWFEFVTKHSDAKPEQIYKWREEPRPVTLHKVIPRQLVNVYTEAQQKIKNNLEEATDESLVKWYKSTLTAFKASKAKLGNDSYQNGVISQARYLFNKRGFIDELDQDPLVLGVRNGVVELGPRPKLIKGFHEHRVSKYTPVDYVPYDKNNYHVQSLRTAFKDIFPEKDVFKFMMYFLGTCVTSDLPDSMLIILVGGGSNGKTFFLQMIHNALGNEYCSAGKPALLTSPTERAESGNSALMHMKGKRAFYFDEFTQCEILNDARVKSLVSAAYQSGRDLYGKQTNFRNSCNPIAATNFDFIITTTDHGTWRRIYRYRNKVTFTDNPDPNNKFEKQKNEDYGKKFINDDHYRSAMLSIMVHYYGKLSTKYNGMLSKVPCPTIQRETNEYRFRQDFMHKFISLMLVRTGSCIDVLSIETLAVKYKQWKEQRGQVNRTLTLDAIQAQFENSFIAKELVYSEDIRGKCLKGYRLRAHADEPIREGESAVMEDLEKPIKSTVNGVNKLSSVRT